MVMSFQTNQFLPFSELVIVLSADYKDQMHLRQYEYSYLLTAWKLSVFRVFLVRISPYSDWIRRNTPYLSVFSPNVGKCGLVKLRIRTPFMQWLLHSVSVPLFELNVDGSKKWMTVFAWFNFFWLYNFFWF